MNYAYNEAVMLESIREYNKEPKTIPVKSLPSGIPTLLKRISQSMHISPELLTQPTREKRFVRARWAVVMVLREQGYSYNAMGRFLKRHHTSVLDLYRNARKHYDSNPEFKAIVDLHSNAQLVKRNKVGLPI